MAIKVPRQLGVGGAGLTTKSDGVNVKDLFNSVAKSLLEIKTKFEVHQHQFDGDEGDNSYTSKPRTGNSGNPSGTATGGTAVTVDVDLEKSEDA